MANSVDPDQLDLHCLQKQGMSGFSRTMVQTIFDFRGMDKFEILASSSQRQKSFAGKSSLCFPCILIILMELLLQERIFFFFA